MEFITVYEYTLECTKLWHLLPLLILSFIGFFFAFRIKSMFLSFSYPRQFIMFFCYLLGGIPTIMAIVMLFNVPAILKNEQILRNAVLSKDFNTTEGKVEEYSIKQVSGQNIESFIVNGVKFEYSDFVDKIGFNQTSSNNGPVKRNGQYLKISYIVLNNEKLILKLEVANKDILN